ncbi:MAG: hypothetical protein U0O43_04810 [Clostridia bacterium]|jgi:hypothetical protein
MMDRKKQAFLGLAILIVLIIVIVAVTTLKNNKEGILDSNLKQVFVATGGGKENFLADEEVNNIMKQKYGLKVTYDSWSNGKIVKDPLLRKDGSKYDAMFCSDQRFYDYFKVSADTSKGEAQRDRVLEGGLTLNTPIVIYSWDTVVDALIKENIVTQKDNVYYITDMNKLISYILEGKKWSDIGVDMLYGTINIDSTDPVTSSPGATYYGLLLSIMCGGTVTEENLQANLQNLKEFYIKSGYMNNTPADLFELYLKTGVGGKPMIVDYEKSVIDFANSNPDGWEQVKDKIRILYPTPTIWNSHCIATFNETGNEFFKAFEDKDIGQIAWSRYGFRTGITGGNYDVTKVNVSGIPQSITSTVSSLKMKMYDEMISYLGQ